MVQTTMTYWVDDDVKPPEEEEHGERENQQQRTSGNQQETSGNQQGTSGNEPGASGNQEDTSGNRQGMSGSCQGSPQTGSHPLMLSAPSHMNDETSDGLSSLGIPTIKIILASAPISAHGSIEDNSQWGKTMGPVLRLPQFKGYLHPTKYKPYPGLQLMYPTHTPHPLPEPWGKDKHVQRLTKLSAGFFKPATIGTHHLMTSSAYHLRGFYNKTDFST